MLAVLYDRFGDDSVLTLRETAVPQPAPGQVQVRVRMAGLNPADFKLRSGMLRMLGRPRRPAITGMDFAGEISALGAGVQGYEVGQRVFGSVDPLGGRGTCAQFLTAPTNRIAPTPDALNDEVAASLPVASGTALQSLIDIAGLQTGQAVLISGASGAVGASAVQIARWIGAQVTGVCGTANIDYVCALGAERVIDYKLGDWLRPGQHFDVVFDAAAAASFSQARPLLTTEGIYINTMPRSALYFAALVARATSRQRCVPFMLKTDTALLARLAKLAAEHVIVPHIHEVVDLAQVASAQRLMQEGKVHGKVCVRVDA
jgi:NADPH:quinone reductase-like Zn-dependent oxidoreductase